MLVTGAAGFVGTHLLRLLGDRGTSVDVDVTDADAVLHAVRAVRPDAVVHLAALSSVASSWQAGSEVWRVNVLGTVNVLDAVAAAQPAARVVVASTGEVYGDTGDRPASESAPLAPVSPYAASKVAAEIACGRARRIDGVDVVVARPFSHIGPGQEERFAVGSWVHQIARLEGVGGGVLDVGNLDVRRDFLDVRDVCRAYLALLDLDEPALVYNVASGSEIPLREVVERLARLASVPVRVRQDPARVRRADVAVLSGDAGRLRRATGWRPEISLDQTLADALEAARRTIAAGQTTDP